METGFDAPGCQPPAWLPDVYEQAALAVRPVLEAGPQPGAVLVLIDVEAKGLS